MREDRWKVERHPVGGKRQRDLRLKRELGSTGCRSCEVTGSSDTYRRKTGLLDRGPSEPVSFDT